MNNDFPRMLYKAGGPEEIHGGRFHTKLVHDDDELDAALAGGWHKTTPAAVEAAKPTPAPTAAPTQAPVQIPDDNAAPTRGELEQKARELGIDFSPNIGDKKLIERIDAVLAGGEQPKD